MRLRALVVSMLVGGLFVVGGMWIAGSVADNALPDQMIWLGIALFVVGVVGGVLIYQAMGPNPDDRPLGARVTRRRYR